MIDPLTATLTFRQQEILSFVELFFHSNGFPPSLREIGKNFRIAPSSVLDHLRALEKKGFIKRLSNKSRCLEILKKIV